ncbi:MAG TPA: YfhO family protein [Acidimicrobiales bacterium]
MGDDRTPIPPVRGATWREVLGATAVLLVLLAVFLWEPLTSPGQAYTSDDLLQSSPLVRTVPDDYRFGNVMLTDPVLQMHPWLEWNKEQVGDGDLPVWNPYNGAGAPHLANYVSAVLSPFSVPFYVMPWRVALLVSAGLKLFVLGLFTYLFLRKIAVSHVAGLVGAAAFMFAAYNVLWVAWPHPGAVVCLPAGLYFAEVAMQAASRIRQRLAWGGYAVAVLWAFLAGHPETMFFAWGLVLVYVPVRLAVSRQLGGGKERLAKAGQFVVASGLAVGLAAVQLLPFVEYLQRSTAYAEGADRAQAHFELAYAGLHAFPNLFGAPSELYYQPLQLVGGLQLPDGTRLPSNYIESNGFYVGLLVLLLAGVGVVSLVRRQKPAGQAAFGGFAVLAGVVWVVYAHDLGGIGHTVGKLPLVELSAINRSHPIWVFAVCCLAALGVDGLLRAGAGGGRRAWAWAAALAAVGVGVLAGAVVLARHTLDAGGNLGGRVLDPVGKASVDAHLRFVAFTFLAGLAVLVVLVVLGRRGRWLRGVAGLAVVGVVFTQGGWLMRSHNPTVDEDLIGASSPAVVALQKAAGPTEETVSLGALLSADANLWFRLRSPDSYDGVGVRRYEQLQRDLAVLPEPLRGPRTLEVLGIRYVATEQVYPTALPAARLPAPRTFNATLNGLHSVTAVPATGPSTPAACEITLELVEGASGPVAAQAKAPCRKPFTTLSFPPVANSQGKTYTARFGGQADVLAFAPWAQGIVGLEQVDVDDDEVALFRAPAIPGRYFSPADARPVASDEEARRILGSLGFEMGRTVLVHDPGATATTGTAGQVEVLEQRATKVVLRVTRADPGWLVAIQTSYPGWTALVDGQKAEVERADYAFTAVPVGAGTHEVVLRYRPRSVRYGMIVSGEALVLLVIWLATSRPRARRERRARERIPWDPTKAPRRPLPPDEPTAPMAPARPAHWPEDVELEEWPRS